MCPRMDIRQTKDQAGLISSEVFFDKRPSPPDKILDLSEQLLLHLGKERIERRCASIRTVLTMLT